MKQEVLSIIERYNLSLPHIARMSGVTTTVLRGYLLQRTLRHRWADEWIEKAVIEWRNEMYRNRKKLLEKTPYAYVYNDL